MFRYYGRSVILVHTDHVEFTPLPSRAVDSPRFRVSPTTGEVVECAARYHLRRTLPPMRADLEAAILAEPDARDAYAVYGDWLLEHGDPDGELVAVQLALEEAPGDAIAAAGAPPRGRRAVRFDRRVAANRGERPASGPPAISASCRP